MKLVIVTLLILFKSASAMAGGLECDDEKARIAAVFGGKHAKGSPSLEIMNGRTATCLVETKQGHRVCKGRVQLTYPNSDRIGTPSILVRQVNCDI